MTISKAWEWHNEKNPIWLTPCEEFYFLANRWKRANYHRVLDFGCGLGRHSIYFAKEGFEVSAFDLSPEGTENLKDWSKRENLDIDVKMADMLELPYADNSFDCLFAYHVISHTDTKGMHVILNEIQRVLKNDGEFYLTLCSKENFLFNDANAPKIDDNTILKTEDGPEKNVPHFFVSFDEILSLFKDFKIISIRHIDECYFDGAKSSGKHYFVLGQPATCATVNL